MTIDNETLKQWAGLGPFEHATDGYVSVIGDNGYREGVKCAIAAPTLAAEVLVLRKALIAAQTGFQNLVDWTGTKDFDDVIEIIDQALKGGDL